MQERYYHVDKRMGKWRDDGSLYTSAVAKLQILLELDITIWSGIYGLFL